MKNEGNTKITVQDWMDYLYSEKELLSNSDQATTPRLIGSGTLLAASTVSIFQVYPFNLLGGVGFISSLILIYAVIKQIAIFGNRMRIVEEIQLDILLGKLQEVEKIAKRFSSEFEGK